MAQGSDSGSDDLNYRRNTLNTLFRPRITSLCHDVCDTLMSRFSALAMPALSKRTIRYTLERERERERGKFYNHNQEVTEGQTEKLSIHNQEVTEGIIDNQEVTEGIRYTSLHNRSAYLFIYNTLDM